jgi:glycine cleavage system H protein
MKALPAELRYLESHEWIRLEDDVITVGITDFAQRQLSELTFVELPEVGDFFEADDEVAVVESVKAASDIYAPVKGEIIDVNDSLEDSPELINNDPFGEGWIYKMRVSDPSDVEDLLTAEEYERLLP